MEPRDNNYYLRGSRDYYSTYLKELGEWYKGLRPQYIIEVLEQDDDQECLSIYCAYSDSINIDGTKMIFTNVHGDKDTAVNLDSTTKVTITKENN